MENQYKQLTLGERYQIEALNKRHYSARTIAIQLGRSNKTISNELNRLKGQAYCAQQAHQQARFRRVNASKHSKCTPTISEQVYSLLCLGLSPEQISGRMQQEKQPQALSTNTLYRLVWRKGWQPLLARKGKNYHKGNKASAGAKLIPNRVDIDQRPAIVDEKQEVGHWEGDTVYGQDGYFVTLVERVSKLFLTCRVANKSKKVVTKAIHKMLKPFKSLCKTITFDNGGEFAGHETLKKRLKCDIYFAKPYHSWQRGLSEN